jgi:hypothetical protein
MFWNKKEDDSALPDPPQSKSGFNFHQSTQPPVEEDEESVEKHVLPAFPDSPMKKGFSQAAIKDAVSEDSGEPDDLDEEENAPSPFEGMKESKNIKTIEMSNSAIPAPPEERIPSIIESQQIKKRSAITQQVSEPESDIVSTNSEIETLPSPRFKMPETKKENIFVKIDKFYSAKKALESTKNQLEQIEELLKKIRETKLKEERELENWEKDLMTAKARIQEVNENIFEKIE